MKTVPDRTVGYMERANPTVGYVAAPNRTARWGLQYHYYYPKTAPNRTASKDLQYNIRNRTEPHQSYIHSIHFRFLLKTAPNRTAAFIFELKITPCTRRADGRKINMISSTYRSNY